MKNNSLKLFFGLFLFVAQAIHAQKEQGEIKYAIDFKTTDPEMQAALSMMQGSTMDFYFNEGKSRTDLNFGTMMKMSTVVNSKENVALILSDMMGQKNALKSTPDELKLQNPQPKYSVEFLNEQKSIVGFSCKKAILTDENGESFEVWYTEDLKVSADGQAFVSPLIPGVPLEYEMNMQGMEMKLTATSFEKNAPKSKFETTVPEGYTLEENKTIGK